MPPSPNRASSEMMVARCSDGMRALSQPCLTGMYTPKAAVDHALRDAPHQRVAEDLREAHERRDDACDPDEVLPEQVEEVLLPRVEAVDEEDALHQGRQHHEAHDAVAQAVDHAGARDAPRFAGVVYGPVSYT